MESILSWVPKSHYEPPASCPPPASASERPTGFRPPPGLPSASERHDHGIEFLHAPLALRRWRFAANSLRWQSGESSLSSMPCVRKSSSRFLTSNTALHHENAIDGYWCNHRPRTNRAEPAPPLEPLQKEGGADSSKTASRARVRFHLTLVDAELFRSLRVPNFQNPKT